MAQKDYAQMAAQIVELVGGKENVKSVTHCITRVRFVLRDQAKAHENEKAIQDVPGVLKTVEANGQFQVCIGTDVDNVYDEVVALTGNVGGEVAADDGEADEKRSVGGIVMALISSTIMPIVPGIIGCGLISALSTILMVCGVLDSASPTYTLLNGCSSACTFFMPLMAAAQAAKVMKINPWVGGALAACMLYPCINDATLAGSTVTIFGFIPLNYVDYTSSIFPTIIAVVFATPLYKFFKKTMPRTVSFFMVPFLTLIIAIPVSLVVIGPVVNLLSQGLAVVLNAIYAINPYVFAVVLGATWIPFIVPLGIHNVIAMGFYVNFLTQGYDVALGLLSVFTASVGVCLAGYLKSKDEDRKSLLLSAAATGIMGVSEPSLFGFVLLHKETLIATSVGGGLGSLIAAFFNVTLYSLGASGIFQFTCFVSPTGDMTGVIGFFVANAVSLVVAFVITWFMKFDVDGTQA